MRFLANCKKKTSYYSAHQTEFLSVEVNLKYPIKFMDFLRKLHSLFEKFFLNQDKVKIAAGEHFQFFVVFFWCFCF